MGIVDGGLGWFGFGLNWVTEYWRFFFEPVLVPCFVGCCYPRIFFLCEPLFCIFGRSVHMGLPRWLDWRAAVALVAVVVVVVYRIPSLYSKDCTCVLVGLRVALATSACMCHLG